MPSVLITGANRGLGLEFTRQYAADGWRVFAACRDPAGARDLAAVEGDVSAETLARTTVGEWGQGSPVNFERALKFGDELGGHMVSGHIDGVATVVGVTEEGESRRIIFEAPDSPDDPDGLHRMIAAKGSVAVDGVSLTVNEVEDNRFGVNVIPHTLQTTTLGALKPGDRVNLEIDMLARYVARLLEGK